MKATIENIRKKFGILSAEEKAALETDAGQQAAGVDDTSEYSSHTFTVVKDGRCIGILNVSDVGNDVKECVGDFLRMLVSDEKASEDDVLSVRVSDTGESGNPEEIYKGTVAGYDAA